MTPKMKITIADMNSIKTEIETSTFLLPIAPSSF